MSESAPAQRTNLRRTPLYHSHVELGGKIVPFAGWELPVQYSGVVAEHHAVRRHAGLFDVSHMGEIFVTGVEAEAALQFLTCNDVTALTDGRAQYSALTNSEGGVEDDIIIYRYSKERYLLCVNAANADADFKWLGSHNRWNACFEDRSHEFGQIALQGPASVAILSAMTSSASSLKELPYFHFTESEIAGIPTIVARTGYTGEDGYELFVPWERTVAVWNAALEAGAERGLVPAGLGARDSLRLEACYPLHGHELGSAISAIESGLGWVVKLKKGDFLGRSVLAAHKQEGAPRSLVGFFVDDPGIARQGDRIWSAEGEEVGVVTSGTKTPTVNRALGLGLVRSSSAALDTPLMIEVRGKRLASHVVARPFYKRG